MKKRRTADIVNIGAVALNTVANFVYFFVLDLDVRGLALGHATAYAAGATALLLLIRRRIDGVEGARVLGSIGRTLAAGGLTAATAWLVARWLGERAGVAA